MKVIVITLLNIFLILALYGQNIEGDTAYFNKLLPIVTDSSWDGAIIGFTAKDLTDDKLILDFNGNYKLIPASILKIISTSAALHILSPQFRFKTEFYINGNIVDSVLNGNIIIKGYGDPTLYSHFFDSCYQKNSPYDSIVLLLKKKGIKIINGSIIGDASFYDYNLPTSTWSVGDIANYYGSSPTALNIYNNEYSLFFRTADTIGYATLLSISPQNIPIELINKVKSAKISGDKSIIYGDIFDSTRIIVGSIPIKSDSFEVRGSIPNPPLAAAIALQIKLKENGIKCQNTPLYRMEYNYIPDTNEKNILFYTHYSPPLSDIVFATNLYSINLFAESIVRMCASKLYKTTSIESGILAIKRFWEKTTGNMLLYDASGLSRYNAVSTRQFVSVLEFMYKKSEYKNYLYNSLPIAGKSGTLSKMFVNSKAKGKVIAKTGTMTNIRSLAGYIITNNNHIIAFTIIVNNCPQSSKWIKNKIEDIILKLFFS